MQVKLSGPGTGDIMTKVAELLDAAKDACIAFSTSKVKDMQMQDTNLQELHRRRQRLESEVKALEERKRKALQPTKTEAMKQGTRPLTAEQEAAHKAKIEAERERRKAEAEAKRTEPLKHGIKGLESVVLDVQASTPQQQ